MEPRGNGRYTVLSPPSWAPRNQCAWLPIGTASLPEHRTGGHRWRGGLEGKQKTSSQTEARSWDLIFTHYEAATPPPDTTTGFCSAQIPVGVFLGSYLYNTGPPKMRILLCPRECPFINGVVHSVLLNSPLFLSTVHLRLVLCQLAETQHGRPARWPPVWSTGRLFPVSWCLLCPSGDVAGL